MEKDRNITPRSYVGPLAEVESWADDFISGIIYCSLLEQLIEKQLAVGAVLESVAAGKFESHGDSHVAAMEEDKDLEKVWITLLDNYRYEA